jgi:hypothetical protein
MKRKAQLVGIFTMILLVFTVGLKGTFDGYYGFYYPENNYKKPYAFSLCEKIIELKPVSLFLSYTGFDTAYGFFAPNVASDFILQFEMKDKAGNIVENSIMPHFKNKESVVRYTSVFNMFLDKISDKGIVDSKDNKYQQYLDIIIKQIAINVKKQNPNADHITAKLYLYNYPSLENCKNGKKNESLIFISDYK